MCNNLGIYIHIPFCASKCNYCNFYSILPNDKLINDYIDAVCVELSFYRNVNKIVNSIYLGGGTPNILSFKHFVKILETIRQIFKVSDSVEITVEANPNLITAEFIQELVLLRINRISIGVQSFNDRDLIFLGRKHNSKMAKEAINIAKSNGIKNISIDLILGLPSQTVQQFKEAISIAESFEVKHISGYLLKVENNTRLYNKQILNKLPSEEETVKLYESFVNTVEQHNFNQYEISNFSKITYQSIHNLKYWKCKEYIGLGTAAHSYFQGFRYYIVNNVANYINNMKHADQRLKYKKGCLPPHLQVNTQDLKRTDEMQIYYMEPCNLFEEHVMLGLRLTQGIFFNDLKKIDNERYLQFLNKLNLYKNLSKYVIYDNEKLRLTLKGFLVSNYIIANLLY